jgi:hypothetical protein
MGSYNLNLDFSIIKAISVTKIIVGGWYVVFLGGWLCHLFYFIKKKTNIASTSFFKKKKSGMWVWLSRPKHEFVLGTNACPSSLGAIDLFKK